MPPLTLHYTLKNPHTASQRKRYLVDNRTGIVYERPATTASNVWPKVVGTWDRVRRVLTPKSTAARSGK